MLWLLLTIVPVTAVIDLAVSKEDIDRAVAVTAPVFWGRGLRQRGELRVLTLCLAGDAKRSSHCSWSSLLESSLRSALPHQVSVHDESSYLESESQRQGGPSNVSLEMASQLRLSFESKPREQWPNLIILQSSGDCDPTLDYATGLDHLLRAINKKYRSNHSPLPDYLLIETPRLRELLAFNRTSPESWSRLEVFWHFDKSLLRHQNLFDLARFYRYPMLSMADVCLPSYVRYFLCEECQEGWAYMEDGVRLSHKGMLLLVLDMIVPFLVDQINKTSSEEVIRSSFYDDPAVVYSP